MLDVYCQLKQFCQQGLQIKYQYVVCVVVQCEDDCYVYGDDYVGQCVEFLFGVGLLFVVVVCVNYIGDGVLGGIQYQQCVDDEL